MEVHPKKINPKTQNFHSKMETKNVQNLREKRKLFLNTPKIRWY